MVVVGSLSAVWLKRATGGRRGRRKAKVLPSPSLDSAQMWPPWASTIDLLDVQAQAGAAGGGFHFADPEEFGKQVRQGFRRDADAVIGNGGFDLVAMMA